MINLLGVNAKFKCLEKWFRSYTSVMIITNYILLGSLLINIKLFQKMQESYSTWFLFSWCSAAMSLAFSVTLSKKSPAWP